MRVPINLTYSNRPLKDFLTIIHWFIAYLRPKKQQSHNLNLVNVLNAYDEFCELVALWQKNQAKYERESSCGMREAIPGIALNLKTNCLLTLSTLLATSHRPLLNIDCESAGIYVKKYL